MKKQQTAAKRKATTTAKRAASGAATVATLRQATRRKPSITELYQMSSMQRRELLSRGIIGLYDLPPDLRDMMARGLA